MTCWYVAWKDLKILLKDTGALILLFILPIVVITIASYALSDIFQDQLKPPRVLLVDLDHSPMSGQLREDLTARADLTIEDTFDSHGVRHPMSSEAARRQIKDGNSVAAIFIPRGFGEKLQAGQPTELTLLQNPAEPIPLGIVRGILQNVTGRLSLQAIAAQVAVQEVVTATQGQLNPREVLRSVLQRMRQHEQMPAVRLQTQDASLLPGRKFDAFKQNVPGYAVMFALFTMMGGGNALLKERELGTFRRLLAAPVARANILVGKLMANFFIALLEVALFFAFASLVFGMELGNSLPGLALMAGAVALTATSMGILMAALVRTQAQLSYASVLIVLTMSSLGGSWWPLDIVPGFMRTLAHLITINAWAMDGFQDLLWYGRGMLDILPEVGVLLGIATAAFAVGLWRFQFD
jgi:ABC-2 type transport system permease protein